MKDNNILKAAIYPYDENMYPYLKHSSMLEGIEIQLALSPAEWGDGDKTIAGCNIQTSLSESDYDKIDTLWLANSQNELSDIELLRVVKEIFKRDKKVILTRQLHQNTYEEIKRLATVYSGKLIEKLSDKTPYNAALENIPAKLEVPRAHVITVAGMGDRTDKFLVQLELKSYLEKKGYTVALVSSRGDSEFLKGVYPFPAFMDKNMLSEYKIFMYNRFLTELDAGLKPDIIINAVPGGILSTSKSHPEHFGLHAFEIFNAASPEFTVLCLYGNRVSGRYLSDLKQVMQYKFNTTADCFYISRSAPDINKMIKTGKLEYFDKSEAEINDIRKMLKIDTKGYEIMCIGDEFDKIGEKSVDKLKEL
jgi:peptide maturation system protein (TIGR04066 family)